MVCVAVILSGRVESNLQASLMAQPNLSRFHVRLTKDMAETLVEYFDGFAGNGVVTLEVNAAGVWFVDAETQRVRFLGQADFTADQLARMRARCH